MQLFYPAPPEPGKIFNLYVENFIGKVQVHWYLNDSLIYESGCPDEPCHEAFSIPQNAQGKELRIIARDNTARIAEITLVIGETRNDTSPAAAAM